MQRSIVLTATVTVKFCQELERSVFFYQPLTAVVFDVFLIDLYAQSYDVLHPKIAKIENIATAVFIDKANTVSQKGRTFSFDTNVVHWPIFVIFG